MRPSPGPRLGLEKLDQRLSSKAKKGHAALASVKTQPRKPASAFAAARGIDSRAAIDQRPDVPGHPPAQAAQ